MGVPYTFLYFIRESYRLQFCNENCIKQLPLSNSAVSSHSRLNFTFICVYIYCIYARSQCLYNGGSEMIFLLVHSEIRWLYFFIFFIYYQKKTNIKRNKCEINVIKYLLYSIIYIIRHCIFYTNYYYISAFMYILIISQSYTLKIVCEIDNTRFARGEKHATSSKRNNRSKFNSLLSFSLFLHRPYILCSE